MAEEEIVSAELSALDWQRIVEALAYYAKHCEKPDQPVITVLSLGDLSARDIAQAAEDRSIISYYS